MLQGTLDVFSLDEVLGLLSGANKSGVLNVTGDRGVGAISLADGHLVAGSASCAPDATELHDVIFELLRFAEGSFSFDGNANVDGDPHDIETVLNAAHARLSEWLQIEAVVPSLDHRLALAENLATSQVTITENEWAAIVAIGEGASVGVVAGRLDLGEFDGSKRVKGLIERELVTITEGSSVSAEPVTPVMEPVEAPVFETPAPAPTTLDVAADEAEVDAGLRITPVVESVFETEAESAPEAPAFADETEIETETEVPPMPEAPAFAHETETETGTGTETEIPPMPEAPAFADGEIPPMPEAPETAFDRDEVPTFADGEIPPMPEPPAPQLESAIAEEFAATPQAVADEIVRPAHEGQHDSFGGLDPIGSVDMFEEPQRAAEPTSAEQIATQHAVDVPPPPAPPMPETDADVPSFAPPAFDPEDFPVNDDPADMAGDPFAPVEGDTAPESAADASAEEEAEPERGGSLLMRYLKSNH